MMSFILALNFLYSLVIVETCYRTENPSLVQTESTKAREGKFE